MLFLIYSATDASTIKSNLGLPEYSYYFVLKELRPVLEKMGRVQVVADPAVEVDPLYDACVAQGEGCVFLSFSPPNKTLTTLRCPTIPVFAWEFDTLPNEVWDGNPNNDWTRVLAKLGRAITHSQHTVATVRRAMGQDFPVVSIPSPVWDRFNDFRQKFPPQIKQSPVQLEVQGRVLDTAAMSLAADVEADGQGVFHKTLRYRFDSTKRFALEWYRDAVRDLLPVRIAQSISGAARKINWWRQRLGQPQTSGETAVPSYSVTLSGVVYTTVMNPYDGRKNWHDMVTAFCEAFAEVPDATLVLKFTCLNSDWAFAVLDDAVRRSPPFKCRVIGIHGYLDDSSYEKLIAASTFTVNSSTGEGQCLPLMEFMACGKPAVAPRHTAMEDYIDEQVAFIVDSAEQPCCWPHDPRNVRRSHSHRLNWRSLYLAYIESYNVARKNPERYLQMSHAAIQRLKDHASHWIAIERLEYFLGLRDTDPDEPQIDEVPYSSNDIPKDCGLKDAAKSGWFNQQTGELVPGFAISPDDVVVDVGCGAGGASLFCAKQMATVYFSDIEAEKVQQAAENIAAAGNERCHGLVSDTSPLPLEDGIATRVIAMEMLEHVDDPKQILQELVRVGKPGALYLLSVPDAKGEYLQQGLAAPEHFQSPNHVRIFSRDDFAQLVEDAGLVIERRQNVGFYWVIWMYLFWAYHKVSGEPFDGATLDKLAPPYPQALVDWSLLWQQLLDTPEGLDIKGVLDESLAKSQVIVARKP